MKERTTRPRRKVATEKVGKRRPAKKKKTVVAKRRKTTAAVVKKKKTVAAAKRKVADHANLKMATRLLKLIGGRRDVALIDDRCVEGEQQVTAGDIAMFHFTNEQSYGIYLLMPDGTVRSSCIDFDCHEERPDPKWKSKTRKLARVLREWGMCPVVEVSQSGRGSHVWLFFAQSVPAWKVRAFWRTVDHHLKIGIVEIFPRQDSLDGIKFGNPIRLPLYNKSRFVDEKRDFQELKSLKVLMTVKRATEQDLERVADKLGVELKQPINRRSLKQSGSDRDLPTRVEELLNDEDSLLARRWNGDTSNLQDTSRSALVQSIACLLVYAYVPTDEIEMAIRYWCNDQKYDKGEREDWVVGIISNAYALAARTVDQRQMNRKLNGPAVVKKTIELKLSK